MTLATVDELGRSGNDLEGIFVAFRALAEEYWGVLKMVERLDPAALLDERSDPHTRATALREKLAMAVPDVEEAADLLGVSYVLTARAPRAAGGFEFHRNAFRDVYDRAPLAIPYNSIRDVLNECIAVARKGPRQRQATSIAGRRIAIGHGGSLLWLELSRFLKERCGLDPDEYNRVATAGLSRTARLLQMLDDAGVAFLVLTGEDEQKDGSTRARESVVHEVGLFQGKLGFSRAIVLLEEGCNEFSNIAGLDQIRFPRGVIKACFEDIRQVLEREGFLRRSAPIDHLPAYRGLRSPLSVVSARFFP